MAKHRPFRSSAYFARQTVCEVHQQRLWCVAASFPNLPSYEFSIMCHFSQVSDVLRLFHRSTVMLSRIFGLSMNPQAVSRLGLCCSEVTQLLRPRCFCRTFQAKGDSPAFCETPKRSSGVVSITKDSPVQQMLALRRYSRLFHRNFAAFDRSF